jgi:hypothetical protein
MGPMGQRVHGNLRTTPGQNMDCWGERLERPHIHDAIQTRWPGGPYFCVSTVSQECPTRSKEATSETAPTQSVRRKSPVRPPNLLAEARRRRLKTSPGPACAMSTAHMGLSFQKPKSICPDAGGNMKMRTGYLLGDGLMSMHEIESLTEASIRLLDCTDGLDHRSMFKSLYDFEGAFDTHSYVREYRPNPVACFDVTSSQRLLNAKTCQTRIAVTAEFAAPAQRRHYRRFSETARNRRHKSSSECRR